MSKLRKSSYAQIFEPNEGQRGLLRSSRASTRCPSLSLNVLLEPESLKALEELGNVLKQVRLRMKKEGYRVVSGKIIKINQHE